MAVLLKNIIFYLVYTCTSTFQHELRILSGPVAYCLMLDNRNVYVQCPYLSVIQFCKQFSFHCITDITASEHFKSFQCSRCSKAWVIFRIVCVLSVNWLYLGSAWVIFRIVCVLSVNWLYLGSCLFATNVIKLLKFRVKHGQVFRFCEGAKYLDDKVVSRLVWKILHNHPI